MISSASGFSIGSSDAIDDRLVLTKAQMKSANDNVFPDVYMCVCSDDGNIYTYNKTNTVDETTGKFRIFESGGGLPEPESKDKLLLSSENETTSELEWKQVDKSEVGSIEFVGTKAEWEALSTEEKAKYDGKKLNFTDSEGENLIDDTAPANNKVYSSEKVENTFHKTITLTTVDGFKTFANSQTVPCMYLINIPVGSSELSSFLTKGVSLSSMSGILAVKKGVVMGEINIDMFLYEGNMRMFASRYYPETEIIVNLKIVDNSYSTSETVCGTWIDGKPIFRKVIQTQTPSTANVTTKVFSELANIDKVIRIDGYIMFGSAEKGFVPVNGAIINDTTFKGTWIADNDVYMDVDAYYTNRNVYIITEYTKITE